MGPYPALMLPKAGFTNPRYWGFNTVGTGIDPGDNHVRLHYVDIVDVWKDI